LSVWGDKTTSFFYELTPGRILDAVEASTGLRCTGRAMALNSMENRVYEIELELDEKPKNPSDRFVIAKFYRPGRWTREQIQEEHDFLSELQEDEIPVVAPKRLTDGATLHVMKEAPIWYAVFPKIGGRSPDELSDEQAAQVGRLLARLHNVGATKKAEHRLTLSPETYGLQNLKHLVDQNILPPDVKAAYVATVETICRITAPWFADTTAIRIHGDCHFGNLLSGRDSLFFVDFDDMVSGPPVQDIWLLTPGRDDYATRLREILLDAYETMRPFDRRTLRLVEPLRALRFVHFSAWIGRRWQDPAFPRAFPHFGTAKYWQDQLVDLKEQLALIME
jgi:Ser/Thr protein kinase RdoA (MazF antagonist)